MNRHRITKNFRVISTILLIAMLPCVLAGCYDNREIDDMAYVIAIGLDKGKYNPLKITLQIASPIQIEGGGGGGEGGESSGGSGGESPVILTTFESPSIYSGINVVNTNISRQIDVSHARAIVFSEELAREGIVKYIRALMRGNDFRGSMFVMVAKGSAEDYLKNVKPTLEINPSKYFQMLNQAYRYTGFSAETTLLHFYMAMECYCYQAVATLASVNKFNSSDEIDIEDSTYKHKGRGYPLVGDYVAGNVPQVGDSKTQIMGLAVFDGDKMVGELDGEETSYYLMITNQYEHSYVTVPDPENNEDFILLDVKQRRKSTKSVKFIDGKPHASVKVDLEGDILSIQSGINYESPEKLSLLEKHVESFFEEGILRFLKKTAEELNSDICSFGEVVRTKFWNWNEWAEFKWLDKYKDTEFTVDVSFKVRRPGHLLRSNEPVSTERSKTE